MEDNFRYNINIVNTSDVPVVCEFSESRSQPLPIAKPSDWQFTIEQFTVPTSNIPYLISPIQIGQTNINKTTWIITLKTDTNTVSMNLIHIPVNDVDKTPATPISKQDISSQYYYITNIAQFTRMMNTAIISAYNILMASEPTLPFAISPYVQFIPDTAKFEFIFEYAWSQSSTCNNAKLGLSLSLNDVMKGFPVEQGTDGRFYISVLDLYFNGYVTPGSTMPARPLTPTFLKMEQEYKSGYAFNSLRKIVFESGSLPIRREYTSTTNGNTDTKGVVTDFTPPIENIGEQRSILYYYPQGPYRYINLEGDTPMRRVDFKAYWMDKLGNYYPILLPSKESANLKLLFNRKKQ